MHTTNAKKTRGESKPFFLFYSICNKLSDVQCSIVNVISFQFSSENWEIFPPDCKDWKFEK